MAPLLEPGAAHGPTDLFRTWSPDRPVGAVELKTSRVKRKAAKIEETPHLRFEIVDQFFVLNPEDKAR